jgi:hypothetical protein
LELGTLFSVRKKNEKDDNFVSDGDYIGNRVDGEETWVMGMCQNYFKVLESF